MVNITIDNIPIEVSDGVSILEAARQNNIEIPTLCYLKEINEIAACRICVVEIDGIDRLVPACDNVVTEGMVIHTNSPRVREARRINMLLLLSEHDCHCATCVRSGNCTLQTLSNDLNIQTLPFHEKIKPNRWDPRSPLIRTESKCVKCMRCVQVCEKMQSMNIWDVSGTGSRTTVNVSYNRDIQEADCVYCGQCITHCPTGALRARDDTTRVYEALGNPDKITIVQVAPAVRSAWAEEFGLTREEATPGRLAAALKLLGFNYVFDTNFSADLTILEEGSEFIERFTHREEYNWPMFTSCCPGWVRFMKSQYPEYTTNLSTAKSPQQMFGAISKSYFAEKIGVDPKNITVISVMPCVSKKSECALPTMNDACGDPDVDIVITTRELIRMLRSDHIRPQRLPEGRFDSPLGSGSGAAVIFGATGGVMDAALRTAYYMITGYNPDADAFSGVRGMNGWKECTFNIPGAGNVKVAVVSGLANARNLMDAIRSGEVSYDFVEVMACPGGCAGGGGQPIHEGSELAEERGSLLWSLDQNAEIRFSHENPEILELYQSYLEKPLSEKSHHLLHTDHTAWDMPMSTNRLR